MRMTNVVATLAVFSLGATAHGVEIGYDFFPDGSAEGATVTLVLNADGGYSFASTSPGEAPEIEIGTYAVAGDVLTITPVGEDPETFTIARDGDTMTLTGDDDFDFSGLTLLNLLLHHF